MSPPLNKESVDVKDLSEVTMREHTFKNPHRKHQQRRFKPARQLISDEVKYIQNNPKVNFDTPTYTSVVAPPSLRPQKHYCDITGLEGRYKSPANGLRYHDVEIYQEVIKNMPPGLDQEYLSLRGANVVLK